MGNPGNSSIKKIIHSYLKLKTRAKINIGLRILSQRKDGYHNISTVFQELKYGDELRICKLERECQFSSNSDWLKNDYTNLCVQTWLKMKKLFPTIKGVDIKLKKQVPAGAGLGGGSSNAAGTIKGLNTLYKLNLTETQMKSIAITLGSDVSFFIKGGTQQGEGRGEKLSTLPCPVNGEILLVIPDIHIDTPWAYNMIKKKLDYIDKSPNFASLLQENLFPVEIFKNDFEKIVFSAYPKIGEIKTALINLGAVYASLSGSGSTVYGIFKNKTNASLAKLHFDSLYHTVVTSPSNAA